MSKTITISLDDILHQIKLSCQIPSVIQEIVTRKIILSTAKEVGINVELEELQQAADKMRLMNQLENADDTWVWLQTNSLSLDDFEEIIYTQIISEKLAQYLFADKVEPFFVEHQLDYAGVVMYEVILDDEDLALELFYALEEGKISFSEIAHRYIQETELRRTGGYRGILHRRDLKPEFSAAVFAAKTPQVLQPILTSKGVHLILVEELIQPQLDENLRSQILLDLFSKWLKKQIDQFEIIKNFESVNQVA